MQVCPPTTKPQTAKLRTKQNRRSKMSTGDSKLNFRLSPSHKKAKSFDNLNANNSTLAINSTDSKALNAMTDAVNIGDMRQTNGKNANEFPFGDITFRFDELKNCESNNQMSINNNSGNSARMDSDDFNYKMVRSNDSNGYGDGRHRNNNNINLIGTNMGNGNGGIHHQNRNREMKYMSPSDQMPAAIVAMNNAIAQLSAVHHEYENVSDTDDTDTNAYRSIAGKPVHSDAKSTFLGLKNTNNNKYYAKSMVDEDTQSNQLYDDSVNVTSADVEEIEPLIDNLDANRITRAPSSIVQYQNVPNNSACFVANAMATTKSRGIECSECGKICCDEMSSKCDNDRDQYCRCQGINSSPTSTTGGTMIMAGIDSPSCSTSMKSAKPITLDNSTSFRMSQSLSQAVYMSTTVPQNIKGSNIMGSHTPTRNSLRHSRMLVVNKNYQAPRRRNPLNIRHPTLARIVYTFHVLVGLVVASLGLWLCWWAPSTSAKENSYWSGLTLMLSGILGLILIGFKRIPRHKLRQHLFTFIRVNSTFVTFVAAICTLVAFTFAIMHLMNIMSPHALCRPVDGFTMNSECTCQFDNTINNSTVRPADHGKFNGGTYYRDLSCGEVMGPFKYILIASSIFNFTGFLLCCILLILLCVRHKRVKRVPYCTATSRNRL